MGIFRSTDPTTFDEVDGIVVSETAPAPNIKGVAANIAILAGQFQRGLTDLTEVGSIGEFHEIYGKSSFSGNLALKNKKFGRLRIIRVVAAAAVSASQTFEDGSTNDIITFTAKQGVGAYGNNIKVKIEAGSSSGKKYTIRDTNTNAVLADEVYDNVAIASVTSATFANSKLVTATVVATTAEPANCDFTALASGSDGTVADGDYETAIAKAEVEQAGNVLFLDTYNATRNGYLETHAATAQDKMVILCGLEADTVANAITDVASFRDTDGRIIYAYPWVQTVIDGVVTYVNPASWYASVISQTSPHIDPAYTANTQYLGGITGLKRNLTRADYINLMKAGISAFEYISSIGPKIRSGVVTQIADSSKTQVARRRMADYLTSSVALYLLNYQNAPNTAENRLAVKSAILAFVNQAEQNGMLPKDSEVQSGVAKLVDTESLNTDLSIGLGFFKILWKQRIYSSMRFIVLVANIGETVVISEQES